VLRSILFKSGKSFIVGNLEDSMVWRGMWDGYPGGPYGWYKDMRSHAPGASPHPTKALEAPSSNQLSGWATVWGLIGAGALGWATVEVLKAASKKSVPDGKLRFQCPFCRGKYAVGIEALKRAKFVRCPKDRNELPLEDVLNHYKVAV
jgi:hypothetical protein